jgi:K+-sensing histidine kinase KdpD
MLPDVAETVIDYARQHNITKIIAEAPRPRWLDSLRGSVVDRLIRRAATLMFTISGGPRRCDR